MRVAFSSPGACSGSSHNLLHGGLTCLWQCAAHHPGILLVGPPFMHLIAQPLMPHGCMFVDMCIQQATQGIVGLQEGFMICAHVCTCGAPDCPSWLQCRQMGCTRSWGHLQAHCRTCCEAAQAPGGPTGTLHCSDCLDVRGTCLKASWPCFCWS